MSVVEVVILMVFALPVVLLCMGLVLYAGIMHGREGSCLCDGKIDMSMRDDQQIAQYYRAYAAQVSNRRYVRAAGAMVRAVQ